MTAEPDRGLEREIRSYRRDPFGFVRFAFPWAKPGTPLAGETGPETWQRELLQQLGEGLCSPEEATRLAVASGHGVGKSALVAWIILWAMSTLPDTRGIVTANTEAQLKTKTWPELAKWHRLAINADWFVHSATAFHSARRGRHPADPVRTRPRRAHRPGLRFPHTLRRGSAQGRRRRRDRRRR